MAKFSSFAGAQDTVVSQNSNQILENASREMKNELSAKKQQSIEQLNKIGLQYDNLSKFIFFAQDHTLYEFDKMLEQVNVKYEEAEGKLAAAEQAKESISLENQLLRD